MERGKLTTWVRKLSSVLSNETLNTMGRQARFMRRERTITAGRLALAFIGALATKQVKSLADILRVFNGLFGTSTAYKPFHNQISKPAFAVFMRQVAMEAMRRWAEKVLEFKPDSPFSRFERIVIQDGTSFAIHENLREVFPGRFKTVKPAAVELHATLELFSESLLNVVLTPDTAPERSALPAASSLRNCLLLADRGYLAIGYLLELLLAGASFVIRAPVSIRPLVLHARTARGREIRKHAGSKLREDLLSKQGSNDLLVSWTLGGQVVEVRLIATWNEERQSFQYLVTNLPRKSFTAAQVTLAYRLRWQVELMFKEWKSYANLHAFDTEKQPITEGLIWASIAAAGLKRFLAHATQHVAGVETSTRKVAMCASDFLNDIVRAIASGKSGKIFAAFDKAICYLAENGLRAHPKRDRQRGRLQLGLEVVGA